MKFKIILLLSILTINTFSQTKFLKGYFINNNDQKTECLIKNVDWRNNPTEFEYKFNENETSKINTINDVKEFCINENVKYIRQIVDIDISSDNIQNYSTQREPIFKNQKVFLKVLVEGTNNLYLYDAEYAPRLFFSNKNVPIQQLIYKNFYESSENTTNSLTNSDYKKQLYINVKCPTDNSSVLNNLEYNTSDLIKYFLKVNNCQGDTTTKAVSIDKKTKINFKAVISLNNSSLNLNSKYGLLSGKYELNKVSNFGFGFEIEFLLPFNNYSWSSFIQPAYNNYNAEKDIIVHNDIFVYNYSTKSTFKYIQIPIGIRKYLFLNSNSKLFFDLIYNQIFPNYSSKVEVNGLEFLDFSNIRQNFAFDIGIQYKKFNLDFRYYTKLELDTSDSGNSYKFSNTSINFKYLLF